MNFKNLTFQECELLENLTFLKCEIINLTFLTGKNKCLRVRLSARSGPHGVCLTIRSLSESTTLPQANVHGGEASLRGYELGILRRIGGAP